MAKYYSFEKVDDKKVFEGLDYSSKKFIRNGDSIWAEMRFNNGTCYYHLFVNSEKMRMLAMKLVRQYVMTEECSMFSSQSTKGRNK